MKRMIKFWLIGAAICFFGLYQRWLIGATLTGPETAAVGRLITINSDIKGDWLIYPPNAADMAKDSDEKTLYMVAQQEGEFTIIFFGVENLKPVISQMDLNVGKKVSPKPTPKPDPDPAPAPISKISQQDKEALIYALQRVISGVDNGSIKTANGARSTFKQALMEKGKVCNGRTCYLRESLQKITDELTEQTDFESAETVKTSFQYFLDQIEENDG